LRLMSPGRIPDESQESRSSEWMSSISFARPAAAFWYSASESLNAFAFLSMSFPSERSSAGDSLNKAMYDAFVSIPTASQAPQSARKGRWRHRGIRAHPGRLRCYQESSWGVGIPGRRHCKAREVRQKSAVRIRGAPRVPALGRSRDPGRTRAILAHFQTVLGRHHGTRTGQGF